MTPSPLSPDLLTFYSEHPINERQILSALAAAGKDLGTLEAEDLFDHDQDHYGGLDATEAVAEAAGAAPGKLVLDICAGMGGPARFFAARHGCRAVGIDINPDRVIGAQRLTQRVGMTDRVGFVQGDATRLPFAASRFDAAVSQEAFLHIPDKARLFAGIHRVLRPGGRLAFTDWIAHPSLDDGDRARLAETIMAKAVHRLDDYVGLVENAGFAAVSATDLTAWWKRILRHRLEMYRRLKGETIRRFGVARHRAYIGAYEFFVAAIEAERIGGVRIGATRP